MKSEYLRTLVESVATGSFSKAAENLFITQSAVSRRIKFLEDQYGHSLIDRSGPVLVATDVGRMVIEKAEKILQLENDLENNLRGISPMFGISFCCTPSFGIIYLPEIMKNFMVLKPDMMELKFFFEMPDEVVDGMRKGQYQLGVVEHSEDYDLSEFETYELPGDEVVFISSPQLGIEEEVISIETVAGFDLYTRKEGCCSSKLLEYNINKIGKSHADFKRIIFYDDLHLIIDSVVEGYGLGFVSKSVVKKFMTEMALRIHRVTGFDHAFKRTLIINKCYAPTRVLDNLICEIKNAFKKTTPKVFISTLNTAIFSLSFVDQYLY